MFVKNGPAGRLFGESFGAVRRSNGTFTCRPTMLASGLRNLDRYKTIRINIHIINRSSKREIELYSKWKSSRDTQQQKSALFEWGKKICPRTFPSPFFHLSVASVRSKWQEEERSPTLVLCETSNWQERMDVRHPCLRWISPNAFISSTVEFSIFVAYLRIYG